MSARHSRPMYEGAATLANERNAIERLCRAKGLRATKLPIAYAIDFALYAKGNARPLLVEYKRRPGIEQYPTIFLSALKVGAGKSLARTTGGRFIFLVESDIAMYRCDLTDREPTHTAPGGRADRGDWQDTELMCHYPREWFQRVEL